MSTENKKNVVELKPEEVPEQEVVQEKTWFGKLDDKIMAHRAAKAKKKEEKEAAKEAKASERKKINWTKVGAVGATVVGIVGTVAAVVEHNKNTTVVYVDGNCDECPAAEAMDCGNKESDVSEVNSEPAES